MMGSKKLGLGVALLAATLASGVGLADDFKLKVLSAPGATYTDALGISSAGVIVGTYFLLASSTTYSYTYDTRLKSPAFVTLNMPAAHGGTVTETVAAAISLRGDIVGHYTEAVAGTGTTYGFLYSGGTFTSIEFPGAAQTQATAIASQGGYIAGTYYMPADSVGHAFVYHLGTYTEIKGNGLVHSYSSVEPLNVNNSGYVTGFYHWVDADEDRFFTTTGHVGYDFDPVTDQYCAIDDANPPGDVLVGYCQKAGTNPLIPLYMSNGSRIPFSVAGATTTRLDAVNVNGLVAGITSTDKNGLIDHAVFDGQTRHIFSARGGSVVATAAVPADWDNVVIFGVNAAGRIVGRFLQQGDGRTRAFWAH